MSDAVMSQTRELDRPDYAARRRKRYAADRRLRLYGVAAISIAVALLATLITTLAIGGYSAFVQTHIRVDFSISTEYVDPANPAEGNYRAVVRDALLGLFPQVQTPGEQRALSQILTSNTQFFVRDAVVRNPSVIGRTLTMEVPAADPFDQLNKGVISRDLPEDRRRVSDQESGCRRSRRGPS